MKKREKGPLRSYEFVYRPAGRRDIPLRRGWVLARSSRDAKRRARSDFARRLGPVVVVRAVLATPNGTIAIPLPDDHDKTGINLHVVARTVTPG